MVVFLFFRFLFLGLLLFRELLPFCFFVPPTSRFFSFCRCQEEQFFVYCSVNYIFYGGFDFLFEKMGIPSVLSYKLAYGIAFLVAVLFAFFSNKYMVFRKKEGKLFKEILSFFALRISSGLASFFLLVLLVDVLRLTHTAGWILSSVINLLVNYIGSKFFIFQ